MNRFNLSTAYRSHRNPLSGLRQTPRAWVYWRRSQLVKEPIHGPYLIPDAVTVSKGAKEEFDDPSIILASLNVFSRRRTQLV